MHPEKNLELGDVLGGPAPKSRVIGETRKDEEDDYGHAPQPKRKRRKLSRKERLKRRRQRKHN